MISVGIFWVHKNEVIGQVEERDTANVNETGLIDSDFQHIDEWSRLRAASKYARELSGKAYESILRGRVLFDVRKNKHVIYTDVRSISALNKKHVLDFFGLKGVRVDWRYDQHYSLRENISSLFDDWDD